MNAGAKRINPSGRAKIDTAKNLIRFSTSPFDGGGFVKTAISELRKEGIEIIYDKNKCRYYNTKTISSIWGYNTTNL
jgi:hypothetical protein